MADDGRRDEAEDSAPKYNFREQAEEVDPNDPRFSSKWSKTNGKGLDSTGGGTGTTLPVIHTWGEPDTRPLTAWGIRDLMGVSWLAILSGAWGSAKTFLIIEMMFSYVTGERFAKFDVERTGGVLIVIPESPEQVPRRLSALTEAKLNPWYLQQGKAIPARYPIKWVEDCTDISTPAGFEQLKLLVESTRAQFKSEFGVELAAVFIDTSSAAAPNYKINDPMETSRLYANLQRLRQQANIALLIIDHMGKDHDRGTTGGAGKEQKADTVMYSIEIAEGEFKLHVRKVREARQNYKIAFALTDYTLATPAENGDQVRSKIIRWHNNGEPENETEGKKRGRPATNLPEAIRAINRALSDHGQMRKVGGNGVVEFVHNTCTWLQAEQAFFDLSPPENGEPIADRKKSNRKFRDALKTEIHAGGLIGMYKTENTLTPETYLWLTQTRRE